MKKGGPYLNSLLNPALKCRVILAAFLVFTLLSEPLYPQDIGAVQFAAPVSACTLKSNETVQILILNFGNTTITTPFSVSYRINNNPPVTETVTVPFIPPSTTYSYSFITPANLSAPGTYTLTAYASLSTDINRNNDTLRNYLVVNDPLSVGGSVSASTSVCLGNNSGTLVLNGRTGNILNWEYSTNGGVTWTTIPNTTNTQPYSNLTVTTHYRAVVKSGLCPQVNSAPAILTIDQPSVGGNVSGAKTVCSGVNSGSLSLSGQTGTVIRWEYSTDGGTTWNSITNTNTNFTFSNLTTTTLYRAVVKNGNCPSANSTTATITVDPQSVGGAVLTSDTVCGGTNADTLLLSGHTGSVVRWEFSTNGGTSWQNTTNTSNQHSYTNLISTTIYRVMVKSGICPFTYSAPATITVNPATVAGTISGSDTLCQGANNGTLLLNGSSGSILRWEYSTNGGTNWNTIPNTTNSHPFTNISTTTFYRVVVKSGVCPSMYSTTGVIKIDPATIPGILNGGGIGCKGSNNGTLVLSSYAGKILSWEYSVNGGLTWNSLPNTTPALTYSNLTTTTVYRVNVKNGICPVDTSSNLAITVLPLPFVNAGKDSTIRLGDSLRLLGFGSFGIVQWSPATGLDNPGNSNPIAKPKVTTNYILTITDANGCSNSDTVRITIFGTVPIPPDYYKKITNLITRNGDGINDVWYIENIENYPYSIVSIYNIYGKEVFSASPYLNDWDGTHNGNKLPDGTYYYLLRFENSDYVFKGSLTLINE